eukprot:120645_1
MLPPLHLDAGKIQSSNSLSNPSIKDNSRYAALNVSNENIQQKPSCCCVRNLKIVKSKCAYIRIIIMGCLSWLIIWSVYKFLSSVDSIQVISRNNPNNVIEFPIINGIGCYATQNILGIPWDHPNDFEKSKCDTMTNLMANATEFNTTINSTDLNLIITPNIKWRCDLYTDYSDKLLFDTFSSCKSYLYCLFVSAAIYAASTIIHDCTLIYHKSNLKIVTFHPSTLNDFYLTNKLLPGIISGISSLFKLNFFVSIVSIFLILVTCPIWGSIVTLLFCIDICTYLLCLYPLVRYLFYKGENVKYCTNILSYISCSWVGVSKFFMVLGTAVMLSKLSRSISNEIPSADGRMCECSCFYVLHKTDFYKWLFVTFPFILVNLKSMWSWLNESIHTHHYLYLISYSLPLVYANAINPADCSGSMMVKTDVTLLTNNNNNDVECNEEYLVIKTENVVAFFWRGFILVLIIVEFSVFGLLSVYRIYVVNVYNYNHYIEIILLVSVIVGAVVAFAVLVGVMLYLVKHIRYLARTYSTQQQLRKQKNKGKKRNRRKKKERKSHQKQRKEQKQKMIQEND